MDNIVKQFVVKTIKQLITIREKEARASINPVLYRKEFDNFFASQKEEVIVTYEDISIGDILSDVFMEMSETTDALINRAKKAGKEA